MIDDLIQRLRARDDALLDEAAAQLEHLQSELATFIAAHRQAQDELARHTHTLDVFAQRHAAYDDYQRAAYGRALRWARAWKRAAKRGRASDGEVV